MYKFTVTQDELTTLTNGLRVAAERYEEHARALEDVTADNPVITVAAAQRLACQFTKQARESRALADKLEEAEPFNG